MLKSNILHFLLSTDKKSCLFTHMYAAVEMASQS